MKRGLPIAAYMTGLAAAAVAAAFLAALVVLVLLPPRPPSLARGDQLIEAFTQAYGEVKAGKRPSPRQRLEFRFAEAAPAPGRNPMAGLLARELAANLQLPRAQVAITSNFVRSDTVVFQFERRGAEGGRAREPLRVLELPPPAPPAPPAPPPPGVEVEVFVREEMERARERVARAGEEIARRQEELLGQMPEFRTFNGAEFRLGPELSRVVLLREFEIAARLPDGRWLVMRRGRNWAELGWIGRAALALGAVLAVLAGLAALLARRIALPVRAFAEAVQAVGVDPQGAPLSPSGPRELREAAGAVNAMQARLRALIADRTRTLAAVAHDMRTPLMRLRLAAENAEPEVRERLAKEVGEVEALVASFIAFAREDPAEERRVRLDLAALLESLAEDQAASGRAVRYAGPERLVVTGQSLGLKRLFANLIDNALKHGRACEVRLLIVGAQVRVEVADDGPGVPEAERERIFEPFVRLSEGGAGLGLAAARSIARAHGGEIIAEGAAGGGAVFVVTLPGG